MLPVFGDGTPAVWRWSRPRIDERPDDLVCRLVRGQLGERVDVFQKDWLHTHGRAAQEAAHDLAGRGGRLDRHRGRGAQGDRRPRLRVPEADRAGPPDPRHHAGRRAWCSTSSPAAARRGTRSRCANAEDGGSRGAASRSTPPSRRCRARTRAAAGLRHRRRHHPGPAAGGGRAGRRRAEEDALGRSADQRRVHRSGPVVSHRSVGPDPAARRARGPNRCRSWPGGRRRRRSSRSA